MSNFYNKRLTLLKNRIVNGSIITSLRKKIVVKLITRGLVLRFAPINKPQRHSPGFSSPKPPAPEEQKENKLPEFLPQFSLFLESSNSNLIFSSITPLTY